MLVKAAEDLVGLSIPPGQHTVSPLENWLGHDALYSEPATVPHPVMAFILAQRGMGVTVAELFALLGTDMADGPLLARTTIELNEPLQESVSYHVTGDVVAAERKTGRTLGTFDLVTCVFRVSRQPSGQPSAIVTNVYALARRSAP